jgi:serine/threonine-protein kinase
MGGERVIVGGRYELGELLGRGGMAEVRKGTDIRLGRVVAVKRLRPDLAEDPVFQARFRREAQSAASLNHPAIVAVYDTGEEPMGDGVHAQPYIVMEYVTGRTLRDILREGRKILPERALEIAAGVLSALDYSHRSGIIHRDIKPANVMLTPSGEVKVMDFGIARALTDSSTGMTQTAAVVGTAQYLSPEQARGESVDARSDVYSTGCLLYELLTGRPPFTGESPVSVAYQHVREAAPAPSMLMPDLSSDIDAIVMKALAKPIDQRYQSAAQMRADIERHLAGLPVLAPPAPAVVEPEPVHPPQDSTTIFAPDLHGVEEREERGGRGRWAFWILLVVMLGLVAAAVFAALSLFKTPPPTVIVPTVTNLTLSQAQSALAPNLSVGQVTNQPSTDVPAGLVISQSPLPGTPVDPDSTVDLVVSSGPDTVAVPNILGYSRTEAQAALETEGLVADLQKQQSDSPKGTVISTEPQAGQKVAKGSTVTVYWSAGPKTIPDLTGLTEDEARAILVNRGFVPDVHYDTSTPGVPGTVVEQVPTAGGTAPQGTTVVIFVIATPPPTTTTAPPPTTTTAPPPTTTTAAP